jgi:hypothetical protein
MNCPKCNKPLVLLIGHTEDNEHILEYWCEQCTISVIEYKKVEENL